MVFNLGSQGVPLWTWLVPLGSAVLLFIASMITLAFTIRSTNRRAKADRDDARERDYHAWRRDTLLRLGADAMAAAVEAVGLYTNFRQRARPVKLGGSGINFVRAIDNAAERVMVCSTTLSLIGAKEAAAECMHLRHAIAETRLREVAVEVAGSGVGLGYDDAQLEELRGDINHRATIFAAVLENELHTVMPVDPSTFRFVVRPGR